MMVKMNFQGTLQKSNAHSKHKQRNTTFKKENHETKMNL